jgi:hypothetical protein
MRKLLILFLLSGIFTGQAQILNAESLRKVTDTSGFSGAATLNFSLKRNVNEFVEIGSDVHLQYKMNKHLYIFKNNIAFEKIEGNNFENTFISHLRYNYRFHRRVAWEAFAQGQYNKVALIDFRGLIGMGPRFKLSTSKKYNLYLGTLLMYEYEKLDDGITPKQRTFRQSTYFSFSLYPTERISIVSTTYYQPSWSDLGDYRISSQSSMVIQFIKNVYFNISYTFVYDRYPAVGIPNSQYDFQTGISYLFD